jgi:drug/metabolite transporter (DMT)-like permease
MSGSAGLATDSKRRWDWLVPCVIALVLWGVWGLVSKLLTDEVGSVEGQILFSFGMLPVALYGAWKVGGRALVASRAGIAYGVIGLGLLAAAGNLCFFAALASGPVSLVSPTISVYPLITVCLAVILLRERISMPQACGIVMAIAGLALLS